MTGGGLVTFGETMALMAAAEVGPWATHRDLKLSVAGAEMNVAIGVRRLGQPATWISRVGADSFGELILRELRAEGVVARAGVDTERPTGLMVKERPNSLRTHVRYYRSGSAAAALTAADISADTVAAASVLHVTGITPALGAGPAEAVEHAVEVARSAGTTVSLDINYRSALWDRETAAAALEPLVARADVVYAGPEEAALIVDDAEPEQQAKGLARLGPAQVVIKLGADGAVSFIDGVVRTPPPGPGGGRSFIDGVVRTTPPVPVRVVDTVGAGDAFVAGYLAELMAGRDAGTRLATAATAGAFACTSLGDWEGLPTRSDLDAFGAAGDVQR